MLILVMFLEIGALDSAIGAHGARMGPLPRMDHVVGPELGARREGFAAQRALVERPSAQAVLYARNHLLEGEHVCREQGRVGAFVNLGCFEVKSRLELVSISSRRLERNHFRRFQFIKSVRLELLIVEILRMMISCGLGLSIS